MPAVVIALRTPLQINNRPCVVCGCAAAEPHRERCTYPGVVARNRADVWGVTRLAASPDEARAEDVLEECNVKALEAWVRAGRLL